MKIICWNDNPILFNLKNNFFLVIIDEEKHWNDNLMPVILKTLDDNQLSYVNNKHRTNSEAKGIFISFLFLRISHGKKRLNDC